MLSPDLLGLRWRKSSYSGHEGDNCVEVARVRPGLVAVRDSKIPSGPVLAIGSGEWSAFLAVVKTDRADLFDPLGLLIADMVAETGEPTEMDRAWADEALAKAVAAQRRRQTVGRDAASTAS
ncbi:hypothetical protein Sme01_00980 [Sphaerisporangium melleum]|uniref:DUF397 domain-containing protein n=1 Tax=Sphaerisporangium melleum TaxID=321316 RepID=A0A917R472_9ACTN|nr:DUF397 domain-containing protein [Sphaerisporangium melleum]GGK88123.1 hypothetical protein GCM10007964_33310 [Sphaerisporangium melleum]GII67622.1 hypothetical protein Sme01_00980 [Sphaerisporangium melleum]